MNSGQFNYLADAKETLDLLEELLLSIEGGKYSSDLYSHIYRLLHNLVGFSGVFGLPALQTHLNQLERDFKKYESTDSISENCVGLFLNGIEISRSILSEAERVEALKQTQHAFGLRALPSAPLFCEPLEINSSVLGRLKWTDDFALGIASIDLAHRQLLQLMSDVLALTHTQQSPEVTSHALSELIGAYKFHVILEETEIKQGRLPAVLSEGHASHHREFLDRINVYDQEIIAGTLRPSRTMLTFLILQGVAHIEFEVGHFRATL